MDDLIRHWALPEVAPECPVAYRAGEPISRACFQRDLAAARRCLAGLAPGELEGRPGLVLFESDTYCFVVWLLAAWSLGRVVVLPGDDLPATREALAIPWVGSGNPANAVSGWGEGGEPDALSGIGDTSMPPGSMPGVMLFTSGSTGKPSLVEKSLRQLRAEAEMFEAAFGERLAPASRFVSSVPHQHMYGLPFFVLWPLISARPFVVEKLRYPEDIARLPAVEAGYVLISAPTFLKHLPDAPEAPDVRWRMATSAGSPLAAEVARRGAAYLRAPLFEIYGSTETGAAACRLGEAPWQALPGVRLALDEESARLRIFSPLLPEAELDAGFLSSDIARWEAGGLVLQGRTDRLVKIGEKRISLAQVEQELARLPEVESARIVPLSHARDQGSGRVLLGAVILLSPAGRLKRAAEKKAHFDARLRNSLQGRIDPLALPRRWRYVDAFPCNEMGKVTRQGLERLFAPLLPRVRRLPQANGEPVGEGVEKLALQLDIPRDLAWFEGHFPGVPVLPGVVQIDWVAHFARLYFDFEVVVTGISSLKFQHTIQPGDKLTLELTLDRGAGTLEFAFIRGGQTCSRAVFKSKKPVGATDAKAGVTAEAVGMA